MLTKTSEMVVQMVLEGRSDREIAEKLGALKATAGEERMESERRDRLVRANTAFGSWGELVGALEAGYVPTLRAGMSEGIDELAALVVAEGFQVWRGTGVIPEWQGLFLEVASQARALMDELDALDAAESDDDEADEGPVAAGKSSETGSAVESESACGKPHSEYEGYHCVLPAGHEGWCGCSPSKSAIVFRATLD